MGAGLRFNLFSGETEQLTRAAYARAVEAQRPQAPAQATPATLFAAPPSPQSRPPARVSLEAHERHGILLDPDHILAPLGKAPDRQRYLQRINDNAFESHELHLIRVLYRKRRPDLAYASIIPSSQQLKLIHDLWPAIQQAIREPERTRLAQVIANGRFTPEDELRLKSHYRDRGS